VSAKPPTAAPSRRRHGVLIAWISPIAGLAVVAAVVWWFVFREAPAERSARLLTDARTAMDARDYATAEERLMAAAKLAPQNAALHHNLGILYLQQNRLRDARAAFERAVAACGPEANQVRAEEYFQLATISYMEKQGAQAARELEQAIAADPAREQLHTRLLDLQLGPLADSTAAAATTQRLLQDTGRTPRHLADAAYIHYQHRSYASALELARAAVAMQDSFTEGHSIEVRSLWKLGRTSEALRTLQEPLQRYPRASELWVSKALLLLDVGKRTEALAAAERAVQLAPRDYEAHQARQMALAASGRLQEALAEVQATRALAKDPVQQRTLQRQEQILRGLLSQTSGKGMLPGPGAADTSGTQP
jgi:tetratricopeptide (TPR) repeat protein